MAMSGGGAMGGETGVAGGFFNSAMDIVGKKVDQEYRSQDRAQEQDYNSYMSNTAVARRMGDLSQSGLNPILAVGSQASGGSGSPSPGGYSSASSFGSGMHAASQAALVSSQIDVNTASAEKIRAESETERQRPGLVSGQTAEISQRIAQSVVELDKIRADTDLARSTAATQFETMKQTQAAVTHIEALVKAVRESTKLTISQTGESKQRVQANMPEIERRLKEVDEILLNFKKPEAFNQSSLHESYLGRLSTLLKGLSPLVR